MALAASSTTNRLSETAISRFSVSFSAFNASDIDCVNARSFVALGATRATFSGALGLLPPPPEVVPLLLQAAAMIATTTTRASSALLRSNFVPMMPPFLVRSRCAQASMSGSSTSSFVGLGQGSRLAESPGDHDERDDRQHGRRHRREVRGALRNDPKRLPREDDRRHHPVQERAGHDA